MNVAIGEFVIAPKYRHTKLRNARLLQQIQDYFGADTHARLLVRGNKRKS